jgi:adenylosuccinate synthase
MKRTAILLSGRSCTGKSDVAKLISRRLSIELVDALVAIQMQFESAGLFAPAQPVEPADRPEVLIEYLNERWLREGTQETLVVDCVWVPAQIHALRRIGWSITHVHLEAPDSVRNARKEAASADQIRNVDCDPHDEAMRKMADLVIDTHRCPTEDVFVRIAARIQDRPMLVEPLIDVIVGGQYGSEGKGNLVQYLAPEYDVLVRVGGPNAGHMVFRTDQEPYIFRQLPSGTLARSPEAKLVIGAGAVILLEQLNKEIQDLEISIEDLIIDPQAMIIEPQDVRFEEETIKAAIGSTAQGTGAATARKITNRWPGSDVRLARDIPELHHYLGDTIEFFSDCLTRKKRIMLEGTQGTSLSIHHGYYPHVTSRVTTAAACLSEAGLSVRHVRRVVMVCRTYPIRVGDSVTGETSGPMSQKVSVEEIARRAQLSAEQIAATEIGSVSRRPRRISEFDWSQLRRSALLNGPTDIALTFADYLDVKNRQAFRYEQLTEQTLRFIEELERVVGVPVSLISTDFSERNIIDRRAW